MKRVQSVVRTRWDMTDAEFRAFDALGWEESHGSWVIWRDEQGPGEPGPEDSLSPAVHDAAEERIAQ